MFHHSSYWGTWSRVLLHPGSMVEGRVYGSYLEVNLTPVNGRYDDSTRKLWEESVAPIILRRHGTAVGVGEMKDRIPPMVVTAMIMNVGADLTRRLITADLLSEIDMDALSRKMRGGGIPLSECLKGGGNA